MDHLVDALAPSLLVYARQCNRLGLWAPTPEDLTRRIMDAWLAARHGPPDSPEPPLTR